MTPTSASKTPRRFTAIKCGRASSGFTLLEILLVLAIIGMASILIVPNMGSLESRSFSAQVREASSLLNYARRIAVVRGMPSAATFYQGSEDGDADSLPEPARNSVGNWESAGASIRYETSSSQQIDVEDKLEIIFYPEGGSTGGSILLAQDEQRATIHVDPFSGRVTVERPED